MKWFKTTVLFPGEPYDMFEFEDFDAMKALKFFIRCAWCIYSWRANVEKSQASMENAVKEYNSERQRPKVNTLNYFIGFQNRIKFT